MHLFVASFVCCWSFLPFDLWSFRFSFAFFFVCGFVRVRLLLHFSAFQISAWFKATSALDSASERQVQKALDELLDAGGRTTIAAGLSKGGGR